MGSPLPLRWRDSVPYCATSPRRDEAEQLAERTLKDAAAADEGVMCRVFSYCLHVAHEVSAQCAPYDCDLCPAADMRGDIEWVAPPSPSWLDTLRYFVDETLLNLANRDRIAFNTIRYKFTFDPARIYTTLPRLGKLNALAEQFEQLAEPTL